RVVRPCMSLDVVAVFAAPREHGFQNFVESYNARWKRRIRGGLRLSSIAATQEASDRFNEAWRRRYEDRARAAPSRRPFPDGWRPSLQAPLRGSAVLIRRADENGNVRALGRSYPVDAARPHELV